VTSWEPPREKNDFRSYFGSPETNYDRATAFAEELLKFIPPMELARLMEGVA